ncbi:MAG: hypothetical protein WAO83_04985 [Fuerstiella sp.]
MATSQKASASLEFTKSVANDEIPLFASFHQTAEGLYFSGQSPPQTARNKKTPQSDSA